MWQIDKFYSATFWVTSSLHPLPPMYGQPYLGTLSAQIYHAMQPIQHQVWRKLGEIRIFVLDRKCNPLLPPYQFKEVFLNIVSLVLCWPLFPPSQKYPNYHAGELGKGGFYVVFISQTQHCHGFIYLCFYSNMMLSYNCDYYGEGWHVFSTRLKAIFVFKATTASWKTPSIC